MNQPAFILEFPLISGCHSQCMHSEYSTKMQSHVISLNLSIGGLTYKISKSINQIIIIIIIIMIIIIVIIMIITLIIVIIKHLNKIIKLT